MNKTRIYVSSTFVDLVDFRAKVNERLRRAGYELVAMEDYPAFDQRPLQKCLDDVASCQIFVGIVGKRYGYIPETDSSQRYSITEWEYIWAGKADIPRLMFQLDPKTPWLEAFDDRLAQDSDGGASIKRFRAHIGKEHGNRFFAVPEELAGLVLEAICAWEKECAKMPTPLPAQQFVTESAFRWPCAWNFSAYMAEKRRGFGGREWLFAEIAAWIADPASHALLIRADFGVGKSAFLCELLARNPGGAIVGWHFCQHDTRETLRAGSFVRSLAAQLREQLPNYMAQVEANDELQVTLDRAQEDPGSAFEAAVLNPLAAMPDPGTPRLIVIDALDEALEVDAADVKRANTLVALLANKARRLPSWLRLIVTSRNNPEVITRLQQAFSLKQIDAAGEHNRDDLYAFALDRVGGSHIATQLAAAGKTAAWLAALLRDKAGGKFLYVARALRDLESERLTLVQAQHLPPGMDSFYLDAFERRFDNAGRDYEPYRALLGLLCVLREPVAADTLAGILGCEISHVKQAHALLPDFIVLRLGGYTFEHFSIAEWLSRENEDGFTRAGKFSVELTKAEDVVRHWAIRRVAEGTAHDVDYLIRHLAFHLPDDAERREVFAKLMLDYRWLRARLQLAGVDGMIVDCRHLGEREEARLLAACLRNAAHVLRRNPEQLAAQLIGRLWNRNLIEGIAEVCKSARTEIENEVREGKRLAALLPITASLLLDTALLAVFEGHEHCVSTLAMLPDGRLASGSFDRTIRLWDVAGGGESLVLGVHGSGVGALAVLPDGRLASGSDDCTIRLWDLEVGSEIRVFKGHELRVNALAVLPDGRITSGSDDGTIRLWDVMGGVEALLLEGHRLSVHALAVLADGRLASGSDDGTIRLWDVMGGGKALLLEGHGLRVRALSELPDGRLASGSDDGTIRLWDLASGRETRVLEGHCLALYALVLLPDGRLASGDDNFKIRLWDLADGGESRGHEDHAVWWGSTLAVLPDGRLASGYDDGTIRLWDVAGGGETQVLEGHAYAVCALAVIADGRLVSRSVDQTIHLMDLAGSCETLMLEGHDFEVYALAALPDGRLASGHDDGTIRLWDVGGSGQALVLEVGHEAKKIRFLMVLAERWLAWGSTDGTIHLWDVTLGGETRVLEGHGLTVYALLVLTDGRLASGSEDGTIRLWDLGGGGEARVLAGHGSAVCALTQLPNGRLASGSYDGTIRLWDVAGGGETLVLEVQDRGAIALAVLPDGRLVATSGQRVLVWHSGLGQICEFHADAPIHDLLALSSGHIVANDASGRLHFLNVIESSRPSATQN